MSDMDNEETEATRELYNPKRIGNIRKKRIAELTEQELRMRCCYDEQYIRILEEKLKMKEDIGIEKY